MLADLVRMANHIAAQFGHRPADDAAEAAAAHVHAFWEPRMTAALLSHLGAGGEGLSPLARAAAERLR